ncbi:head-tail joining protein [Methylobacterium indicum]|uniref:Uncharacterized protein n=1 Tax=Methylobacterium indicum TaxID=1775910 RepID=A0A8H8WSK5_9HYPH|nr:hypothetical protein [Methylobacterium indicum]BCM83594.1 hypothetical protein mvi_20550 [Methylobacterium indicum]
MSGFTYGDSGPTAEVAEALLEVYGTEARYRPKAGGAPLDITVIFRGPRRTATATANGRTEKAKVSGPFVRVPRHVLADARQGDTVDVAGHSWTVAQPPDDDGAVWVILPLQGPIPREPLP